MKFLDVKEGVQTVERRDQKTNQTMNKTPNKFLNNIVLTKIADFFDEYIKFSRHEVTEMIQTLDKNRKFKFENRECVESTLEMNSRSKEPLSECLNESVNNTYYSPDKHTAKPNFLNIFLNLIVRWLPGEANIRSKAPSNLPIHF